MLVKFFMAIVQGYHPLLDRWPLGGQTAKLGVFFAAQHLGSPNHQKVSPEMGEEQLQWFYTICWWLFRGLTFLNNNNRSPTRQWHSRVFFCWGWLSLIFHWTRIRIPQVEVLGRLKLMILHCHGTALRPICLQKLGSLAATPSASRQKIWADRPTTMVGELGMLAMHLMVVFISMVVVNINITHVILLLLLLYKGWWWWWRWCSTSFKSH